MKAAGRLRPIAGSSQPKCWPTISLDNRPESELGLRNTLSASALNPPMLSNLEDDQLPVSTWTTAKSKGKKGKARVSRYFLTYYLLI
jgi:hypothetical protein